MPMITAGRRVQGAFPESRDCTYGCRHKLAIVAVLSALPLWVCHGCGQEPVSGGSPGTTIVQAGGGNAARTQVYSSLPPTQAPRLSWVFQGKYDSARGLGSGGISSSPVGGEDRLFFCSRWGECYSVDPRTGKQRWSSSFRMIIPTWPACANSTVFIGGFGGGGPHLLALDEESGRKKWGFAEGMVGVASSPVVARGSIVFGTTTGVIYALDVLTGAERWHFDIAEDIDPPITKGDDRLQVYSPAVSDGMVCFGAGNGRLYALDVVTGKEMWKVRTLGQAFVPTVVEGKVYYCATQGTKDVLCVLDSKDGSSRWKRQIASHGTDSVAVAKGLVYVFGDLPSGIDKSDGKDAANCVLYVLDANTGAEEWQLALADDPSTGASLAGSTLLFGTHDGQVCAVDIEKRRVRWRFDTGKKEAVTCAPAIIAGVVLFPCSDAKVYAIH